MDFVKQDIHMCKNNAKKCSEINVDADFNIPDSKGDIEKIIAKQGRIIVDEVALEDNKVKVSGAIHFQVVYLIAGRDGEAEFYSNDVRFEDVISMDADSRIGKPEVVSCIEDFNVEVINSRKLSVNALIQNCVKCYDSCERNIVCGIENADDTESLYDKLCVTNRPVCTQDIMRIKEELEIPQNKPNIEEILWSDVELRNMEYRAVDNGIKITGTVEIFAIYKGQEDHLPLQYVYVARALNEEVNVPGASDDMMSDIKCTLGKGDVNIKKDENGEERIIAIDYCANLCIKLYEEKCIDILKDAYSPLKNIEPEFETVDAYNLVTHNRAKTVVSQRRKIDDANKLMQICHVYGDVIVDDFWFDSSLHISGIIKVCVLYVASGNEPISSMQAAIPYEFEVEVNEAECLLDKKNLSDSIDITASLNELNANMVNSEEIDIKAQINLDIVVFAKKEITVITGVNVSDVDMEKKGAAPGIVGYVVGDGDTIWSLARKYYATTDSIRSINSLETDEIKPGDRLLIMKS